MEVAKRRKLDSNGDQRRYSFNSLEHSPSPAPLDQQVENYGDDVSISITDGFRERTRSLLAPTVTTKKKKTPAASKCRPAVTTPLTAEIEEFFAAAEKYEHKRFVDKYNYDIVKDVPLEGRYEWVRLKP